MELILWLALAVIVALLGALAADITVTATSVITTTGQPTRGTAGATIAIGQVVYLDSATSTIKLADSDGAVALKAAVGIAVSGAATGQYMWYLPTGSIFTMNAGLTAGTTYFLSNTAGGICPFADLGAGDYVVRIGYAASTTSFVVDIKDYGVTL